MAELIPKEFAAVSEADYPSRAFWKISEKKRHEINQMIPVLNSLKSKSGKSKLVDIGGGVGNLSRILAAYHGHYCQVIEQNAEFIESGKKKRERETAVKELDQLQFQRGTFGVDEIEYDQKDGRQHCYWGFILAASCPHLSQRI